MKLVRTLSVLLVMTFATGVYAKGDDKKPAAPAAAEPSKADVDKFLAFFDKLVDTVVADKDDCTKMATDVNAIIDANKDLLAMANEASKAGKKLPKSAEDHMKSAAMKMGGAMQKCQSDKGVQAAFMRLAAIGSGDKPADKTPPKTK